MIFVALAAYNEESNIKNLLEGIAKTALDSGLRVRVIVVNDGSKDNTQSVAESCKNILDLNVLSQENAGFMKTLTRAVKTCVDEAKDDDVVITMDADNTHPPSLMPVLLDAINQGGDVVIASRYESGGKMVGVPAYREIFSYGARFVMSVFASIGGVRDFSTSYRAYRARIMKRAFEAYGENIFEGEGFSGLPASLHRLSYLTNKFKEVPLVLRYDFKQGSSSMKIMKTIRGYFTVIKNRLLGRYRPKEPLK